MSEINAWLPGTTVMLVFTRCTTVHSLPVLTEKLVISLQSNANVAQERRHWGDGTHQRLYFVLLEQWLVIWRREYIKISNRTLCRLV